MNSVNKKTSQLSTAECNFASSGEVTGGDSREAASAEDAAQDREVVCKIITYKWSAHNAHPEEIPN